MTMPVIIAERPITDPTDRSMPPVMMTAVMPSAAMATKAKLRVTLKRFWPVRNVSEPIADQDAGDDGGHEHPEGLARQQLGERACRCV